MANGKSGNQGKAGNVGANIASTEIGRAGKRAERNFGALLRKKAIESATFFENLNRDSSNNIYDLMAGVTGMYAFPGGNTPSVKFRVESKSVTRDVNGEMVTEVFAVVFLDSVQVDCGLDGRGDFDKGIFAKVDFIGRLGKDFKSKMDGLRGKTQETIVHHLADFYAKAQMNAKDESRAQRETEMKERRAEIFRQANRNILDFAGKGFNPKQKKLYSIDPKVGTYAFGNEDAFVLMSIKKENIAGRDVFSAKIEHTMGKHPFVTEDLNNETFIMPYMLTVDDFKSKISGSKGKTQDIVVPYLAGIYNAEKDRLLALSDEVLQEMVHAEEEKVAQAKAEEKAKMAARIKNATTDLRPLAETMRGYMSPVYGDYRVSSGLVITVEPDPTGKWKDGLVGVLFSDGEAAIPKAPHYFRLPVVFLRKEVYTGSEKLPKAIYDWQAPVWFTVRKYVNKSVPVETAKAEPATAVTAEASQNTSEVKAEEAVAVPAVAPKKKAPSIVGAKTFDERVAKGEEGKYFLVVDGKRAYFEIAKDGGVKTINLFAVAKGFDKDHILAQLLAKHESVNVNLGDVFNSQKLAIGDIAEIKQARKALRTFLGDQFKVLGLEKTETSAPAKADVVPIKDVATMLQGHERLRVRSVEQEATNA